MSGAAAAGQLHSRAPLRLTNSHLTASSRRPFLRASCRRPARAGALHRRQPVTIVSCCHPRRSSARARSTGPTFSLSSGMLCCTDWTRAGTATQRAKQVSPVRSASLVQGVRGGRPCVHVGSRVRRARVRSPPRAAPRARGRRRPHPPPHPCGLARGREGGDTRQCPSLARSEDGLPGGCGAAVDGRGSGLIWQRWLASCSSCCTTCRRSRCC